VQVGYTIETPERRLTGGTLRFSPGETVKQLPGVTSDAGLVRISLHSPLGAEITTSTQLIASAQTAPFQIARFRGEHVVYWNDRTLHLETATDLTADAWTRLTNAPTSVIVGTDDQRRFYRLAR
jgi:hypothetical protein